ncbi:MAG: hypothetical protein JSR55_13825 [Proteobacteria bacterium]|nr:hypothetical protein [Pseudomonadota bacterium]
MKIGAQAFVALAMINSAAAQNAAATCAAVSGALVIATDGKFLGKATSQFGSDSIFNQFGKGSKFSSDSIWNDFGSYGSRFSSMSAMNPYASDPPMLIKNRQVIGSLTKNKSLTNAIDPVALGAVCFDLSEQDLKDLTE